MTVRFRLSGGRTDRTLSVELLGAIRPEILVHLGFPERSPADGPIAFSILRKFPRRRESSLLNFELLDQFEDDIFLIHSGSKG